MKITRDFPITEQELDFMESIGIAILYAAIAVAAVLIACAIGFALYKLSLFKG